MGFIVEVVSRSGRVIERHRIDRSQVSIGRGYGNDIILTDPYVDAEHAVVHNDFEGLAVDILTAEGHTAIDRQDRGPARISIPSGTEIVLGRTHLRVLSADHPVPTVLRFERLDEWLNRLSQPLPFIGLVLVTFSFWFLDHYLGSYHELDYPQAATQFLSISAGALLWSTIWALVTRVSKGEPRFFQHLLATMLFVVLGIIFGWLVSLVGFNTGSPGAADVVSKLTLGVGLVVLVLLHLRIAFRQSRLMRHVLANSVAWSIVGYTVLGSLSFEDEFVARPEFSSTMLPAIFQWAEPVDKTQFLQESRALFEFPDKSGED